MRVLLVDDDGEQLALRRQILELRGFISDGATTAEQAQALAALTVYDCAIIDLRMPSEEQGLDLLRELRRDHPQLRLVVLTGGSKHSSGIDLARTLADDVLQKGGGAGLLAEYLEALRPGNQAI